MIKFVRRRYGKKKKIWYTWIWEDGRQLKADPVPYANPTQEDIDFAIVNDRAYQKIKRN